MSDNRVNPLFAGRKSIEASNNVAPMAGFLKKKAKFGMWNDRYFMIRDGLLLHNDSKGDVKETLNIRNISSVTCKGISIDIILENGENIILKAPDESLAEEWKRSLLSHYSLHETPNNDYPLEKEGWLLKRSHRKYNLTMQQRYVRVKGSYIKYYKTETDGDNDCQGSISIEQISWVRVFDSSIDCKMFELQEEDRIYVFQANTPSEMKNWIGCIEKARNTLKVAAEKSIQERILAETPPRILLYDKEGQAAYLQFIRKQIEEIYPIDNDDSMPLFSHITCMKGSIVLLKEIIAETKKTSFSNARYDILAVFMEELNYTLSERMFSVLQSDSIQLNAASLSDMHALIVCISNYQRMLIKIYCPVPPDVRGRVNYCGVFDRMHVICNRYVSGNSTGEGGAASHLIDHCVNVWENILKKPDSMIDQHKDNSFFTHAPIDTWDALNQHLSLATETKSPILYAMIAKKIGAALSHVYEIITTFIMNYGIDSKSPHANILDGIQIEFMCAVANDVAAHIEEIVNVVDNFEMDEIRPQINELFDSVTINIVKCGQETLKKITSFIMNDLHEQFDLIYTNTWLQDGNQLNIIIATVSDYLGDLNKYLKEFWRNQIVYNLMEAITMRYITSFLSKGDSSINLSSSSTESETPKKNFFAKLLSRKSKPEDNLKSGPDKKLSMSEPNCVERLEQDMKELETLYEKLLDPEAITLFNNILSEIYLMITFPYEKIPSHVLARISEFPSSAQEIANIAKHCINLRDDIDDEEREEFEMCIKPALMNAAELANQYEQNGIAEGQLGLLYLDIAKPLQKASGADQENKGNTLAQKLRAAAMIKLKSFKNMLDIDDDEEETNTDVTDSQKEEEAIKRRNLAIESNSGSDLVSSIMEEMESMHQYKLELGLAEAEDQIRNEEILRQKKSFMLAMEGHLEKKSPKHNLWQNRWFKLTTRQDFDDSGEETLKYIIMWFEKKGSSVKKSIDVSAIKSIAVLESPRTLCYDADKCVVLLETEAAATSSSAIVKIASQQESVATNIDNMLGFVTAQIQYFSFILSVETVGNDSEGKDMILRAGKVDKIIKWINIISQAADMAYDTKEQVFNRQSKLILHEKRKSQQQQVKKSQSITGDETIRRPIRNRKGISSSSNNITKISVPSTDSLEDD